VKDLLLVGRNEGGIMEEKDDTKKIGERAKNYLDQGFN